MELDLLFKSQLYKIFWQVLVDLALGEHRKYSIWVGNFMLSLTPFYDFKQPWPTGFNCIFVGNDISQRAPWSFWAGQKVWPVMWWRDGFQQSWVQTCQGSRTQDEHFWGTQPDCVVSLPGHMNALHSFPHSHASHINQIALDLPGRPHWRQGVEEQKVDKLATLIL